MKKIMCNDPLGEQIMAEAVFLFMLESSSWVDWRRRCLRVKAAFGGDYPDFWHDAVLARGLPHRIRALHPASAHCPVCDGVVDFGMIGNCEPCRRWADDVLTPLYFGTTGVATQEMERP